MIDQQRRRAWRNCDQAEIDKFQVRLGYGSPAQQYRHGIRVGERRPWTDFQIERARKVLAAPRGSEIGTYCKNGEDGLLWMKGEHSLWMRCYRALLRGQQGQLAARLAARQAVVQPSRIARMQTRLRIWAERVIAETQ